MKQNTIALVYDFDGTLIPKTMQDYTIIPRLKLRSDKFWSDIMEEAEATDGEVMMIYMRQLITLANSMNIKITKSEFKLMASKIEYFKGVPPLPKTLWQCRQLISSQREQSQLGNIP